MSDDADHAADYQLRHNAEALANALAIAARVRAQCAPQCVECGCTIPLKRRIALIGVQRCIDCQTDYEQRGG